MEKLQRHSRKRQAILDAMRATKEHPGAEGIYSALKPEYPELSLGTVYRNIAMFRETGEIVLVATVNGQERYDADTSEHAHFICESCGDIIDVSMKRYAGFISEFMKMAGEEAGGRVDNIKLSFGGVCKNCDKANKETP